MRDTNTPHAHIKTPIFNTSKRRVFRRLSRQALGKDDHKRAKRGDGRQWSFNVENIDLKHEMPSA
jgi:hypothetical protein